MTITAKNVKAERHRVANDKHIMSLTTTGCAFTVKGSEMIRHLKQVSFEKGNGMLIMFADELAGFELKEYRGILQISSRPLMLILKEIFEIKTSGTKFQMNATQDPNIFELKLIQK